MSIFLDQKYLTLLSNRLPLFKRKDDRLYNCRCILCGDSNTNKHKARGYFYHYKNDLKYKCHNCGVSMSFSMFLKTVDAPLHSQYILERFAESAPIVIPKTPKFTKPVFKKENKLDSIMKRVDTLGKDHIAVQYCEKRKLPPDRFAELYFLENSKDLIKLNPTYKDRIFTDEPRLALPFYDAAGELTGVTCRALLANPIRYLTVKLDEEKPLIFGINSINKSKPVHVVEGPIDSLFLKNSIAVAGTGFNKLNQINIPKEKLILIFDNQPRNKEVCKVIENFINMDYNVVIWPQTLEEKDINDMVLAGKNVNSIISKNVYSGLMAKVNFTSWKRC